MVEPLKAPGKTIICMGMVPTHGPMVENMWVSTQWIKNMVMVFTFGLMDVGMKDTGKMENSMAKANISCQMELLR